MKLPKMSLNTANANVVQGSSHENWRQAGFYGLRRIQHFLHLISIFAIFLGRQKETLTFNLLIPEPTLATQSRYL